MPHHRYPPHRAADRRRGRRSPRSRHWSVAKRPPPAPDTGVSAYPFPLTAVQLLTSPFSANAGRTHALPDVPGHRPAAAHVPPQRRACPRRATPCGGWESPTTELRGHSTGHILSALAQAYASTGNTAFKTKGD